MDKEKQIWDLVHHFNTRLAKDEQSKYRMLVSSFDNYYIVYFVVDLRTIRFRIEKNFQLPNNVCYKINSLSMLEESNVDFLYSNLIPHIRELKLDYIGIL